MTVGMSELELVARDVTSVVGDHARLFRVDGSRSCHDNFLRRQIGDGRPAQRIVSARCVRKRIQSDVRLRQGEETGNNN